MALWSMRVSEEYRTSFLARNLIGLPWGEVGDVERYDTRDDLRGVESQRSGASSRWHSGWSESLWSLARRMQIGDLVAVQFEGQSKIHVAEITGNYAFSAGDSPAHTRSVDWIARNLLLTSADDVLKPHGMLESIHLIDRSDAEARMRARAKGEVRGGRVAMPRQPFIWLGEKLWLYGDLCVLLIVVPAVGGVVTGVLLSFSLEVGTAVALGFALWLQVLRAGFDLLNAFRERWEARHLIESTHESPDLDPELLRVWESLRGEGWLFFPTWLHDPLRKALNHLSLLIVGVVALVRVAHGEPTLRLFF